MADELSLPLWTLMSHLERVPQEQLEATTTSYILRNWYTEEQRLLCGVLVYIYLLPAISHYFR